MPWVGDTQHQPCPMCCCWAPVSPYLQSGPAPLPLLITSCTRHAGGETTGSWIRPMVSEATSSLPPLWNARNTLRQPCSMAPLGPLCTHFPGEMLLPQCSHPAWSKSQRALNHWKHQNKLTKPKKFKFLSVLLPFRIPWLQSSTSWLKVFLKQVLSFLCQSWGRHSVANIVSTTSSTWVCG